MPEIATPVTVDLARFSSCVSLVGFSGSSEVTKAFLLPLFL